MSKQQPWPWFKFWFNASRRVFRETPEFQYRAMVVGTGSLMEQDEAAHRAAYLLFREGIRMRLTVRTLQPRTLFTDQGHSEPVPPMITQRSRYTTETLQAHPIASFDDFKRHTSSAGGWQTTAALWVHQEDYKAAVGVLQREGMTVKGGHPMYHSHHQGGTDAGPPIPLHVRLWAIAGVVFVFALLLVGFTRTYLSS